MEVFHPSQVFALRLAIVHPKYEKMTQFIPVTIRSYSITKGIMRPSLVASNILLGGGAILCSGGQLPHVCMELHNQWQPLWNDTAVPHCCRYPLPLYARSAPRAGEHGESQRLSPKHKQQAALSSFPALPPSKSMSQVPPLVQNTHQIRLNDSQSEQDAPSN